MFVPFYYGRGPFILRLFVVTMDVTLFCAVLVSYFNSKRFSPHKSEDLIYACQLGWNAVHEYVSTNPFTATIEILWKANLVMLVVFTTSLSWDLKVIYCDDSSTNTKEVCGIGLYDGSGFANLYGEIKLFILLNIVAVSSLSLSLSSNNTHTHTHKQKLKGNVSSFNLLHILSKTRLK